MEYCNEYLRSYIACKNNSDIEINCSRSENILKVIIKKINTKKKKRFKVLLIKNCNKILIYIEYFDADKLIRKVCTRMSTFLINLIWFGSNICALKLDCY